MSISEEPMVSSKAELRIFIGNGAIQIEDANHKRGGNVDIKGGRKISWQNDTRGECRLSFFRKLDENDSGNDPPEWPFTPAQVPPGTTKLLPDAAKWEGKLATVHDVTGYEYKIHVDMPDGTKYDLDPIIIVR